jgi:hypothetical protein
MALLPIAGALEPAVPVSWQLESPGRAPVLLLGLGVEPELNGAPMWFRLRLPEGIRAAAPVLLSRYPQIATDRIVGSAF